LYCKMIEVERRSQAIQVPGRPTQVEVAPASEVTRSSPYGYGVPDTIDISVSSESSEGDYESSRAESVQSSESETEELTGRVDTKYAALLRALLVILSITACVAVPTIVYTTGQEREEEQFESTFLLLAAKVVDSFELRLERKLSAVDSLQIAVTSHVMNTNASWPFITIPDFDLRGSNANDLGDTLMVALHPLVTSGDRVAWENYTVNSIDWLYQAEARQPSAARELRKTAGDRGLASTRAVTPPDGQNRQEDPGVAPDFSMGHSNDIFKFNDLNEFGVSIDEGDGPYLPAWQHTPLLPDSINYNALSHPVKRIAAVEALESAQVVLTQIENAVDLDGSALLTDFFSRLLQDRLGDPTASYMGDPIATMFSPIFDSFDAESREVVGLFSTLVYFETFFADVLSPDTGGVICVVENGCGDVFSYAIHGQEAIFLRAEDVHDDNYDYIEQRFDVSSLGSTKTLTLSQKRVQLNKDHCPYSLRVYPSKELEEGYVTSQPAFNAASIAGVILFICILSLAYDFFVQRRMKRVLEAAKNSRAIVSSLFPANVRDRMLQENVDRNKQQAGEQRMGRGEQRMTGRGSVFSDPRTRRNSTGSTYNDRQNSNSNEKRRSNERGESIIDSMVDMTMFPVRKAMTAINGLTELAPAKLRLKFFLRNTPQNGEAPLVQDNESEDEDDMVLKRKPIADLFPHCTVLFADISGFTAWSSEREPEQVFTLLQTFFQTFDHLARKRDIFKVETIGDCYVAVTGLPDPQPDHAVRMTKFARECMQKVSVLTSKLEVTLGPGTGDLRMRFGLHSGPVTAGVLRGEKSRFQLFGDTVNTASRMESTGQRNRIQVSQSTAELLLAACKGNWIQAREDLVDVKGKGSIQTFWVLTARRDPSVMNENGEGAMLVLPSLSKESNSDLASIASGDESVWGEDDECASTSNFFDPPPLSQSGEYSRLIEWNVDLLSNFLKQVVAGRSLGSNTTDPQFGPKFLTKQNASILHEVSESIELPKFNFRAAKARAQPSSVELPEPVTEQLRQYVTIIASRYRDNPFHNFAHASHVTMSANKLLMRIVKPEDVNYHRSSVKAIAVDLHDYTYGIASDPLTQFAVMFSALIHDVEHSGVSNAQLSNEDPEMAERFEFRSVAEQNSVEVAWELLMEPRFAELAKCIFADETELTRFRQLLVNLILATDIFDKDMKATRNIRWDKVFSSELNKAESTTDFRNLKATIVIEHVIQAADVAHTMQHWQIYFKWNERLFNELYMAYKAGRSAKDPSEGWYEGELWFFDNYVIPLARKLEECSVFGVASEECLNYALDNRTEWALKGKDIVKSMVSIAEVSRKASGKFGDFLEGKQDQIVFSDQVVGQSGCFDDQVVSVSCDGVSPLVNDGTDKSPQKALVDTSLSLEPPNSPPEPDVLKSGPQRAQDLDEQPVDDDGDGSVVSA
jgi:class 3 adenylate cyclase